MFEIRVTENKEIQLIGRLDASQVDKANEILDTITTTTVLDFSELEYISSAGLGILLEVRKRLDDSGHNLKLKNLNKHISDIFRYAGFDRIFEII
jgi:anti-anti-sigma factor